MARVLALAPDLFFASKIEATLTAAGHDVTLAGSSAAAVAQVANADVVIADLHAEGLDAGAFASAVGDLPILGFYSHVDAEARERGELAGFALVVPRSRMAREMPDLVAGLLG